MLDAELDAISGLMAGPGRPDLAELLDFYRPKWQRDALCSEPEYSADDFFPESGVGGFAAPRQICARCLVRLECLSYALPDPELAGFWGGTSQAERSRARRDGLDAVALLAMLTERDLVACTECSKAGQRLRRGLCDRCYQRARTRAAA